MISGKPAKYKCNCEVGVLVLTTNPRDLRIPLSLFPRYSQAEKEKEYRQERKPHARLWNCGAYQREMHIGKLISGVIEEIETDEGG
jgi:hypothetical protein